MGMSASQARYLSLCARMNDIEYQGQQINQQRTTLSNQVTNYYNSLLDLTVPTPPSTKDFTKIEYSGAYAMNKFTIGNVTPGSQGGLYNVDLNYTKTGHSWGKTGTTNVKKGQQFYVPVSNPVFGSVDNKKHKICEENESLVILTGPNPLSELSNKYDINIYVKMTGAAYKKFLDNTGDSIGSESKVFAMDQGTIDGTLTRLDNDSEDGSKLSLNDSTYYVIALNYSNYQDLFNANGSAKEGVGEVYAVVNENGKYMDQNAEPNVITADDIPYDKTQFKILDESTGNIIEISPECFTVEPNSGHIDIKNGYKLVKSTQERLVSGTKGQDYFVVGDSNQDKIELANGGSQPLTNLNELFSDREKEETKAFIEGLQHAFPDVWNECNGSIDLFLSKFEGAYFSTSSGSTSLKVIKIGDTAGDGMNVPMYEYVANGTYTDTDNTKGCQLEFDTDGRIKKIGIPTDNGWDWVDLKATEVTDSDAYEDAFNKYEYEKYIYDQKQNEINAKISIIQQEDKNLELKLTRLDNERNALNTELEAVKKVISDAIEKDFKTFSG